MTEAELQEMTAIAAATALDAISIYLSILSAFLIVAYIAGKKLTRSQVAIVTTLFVLGALAFSYGTLGSLIRQSDLVVRLAEIQPNATYFVNVWVAWFIAIIQLAGIIACLKFMWEVRHPKIE